MKSNRNPEKFTKPTSKAFGKLILFIAISWAAISTLYLLAGLLIVLHSEPGAIDIFEKLKPWDHINTIAAVASAVAAFMSYGASVNASEIASKVGLMDRRIENYRAFHSLRHHMIQQHYASEAEVSKYYYHSIDSNCLFPEELSTKIADYYDACFAAANNYSLKKQDANRTEEGKKAIETVNKLSPEIEKEMLDILR
jgi:hypothetical protein